VPQALICFELVGRRQTVSFFLTTSCDSIQHSVNVLHANPPANLLLIARSTGLKKSHNARFIKPMEWLPVEKIPDGDNWTYELKLDGYRLQP
jgi:ATP-dependent DNA ligase